MSADRTQELRPRRDELRKVQAYWEGKRRPDGRLPGRPDIDPLELRFALGHLILTDVEPLSPPRFRFRLVGSHVVDRMGFDPTGKYLDTVVNLDRVGQTLGAHRRVVETRAPIVQLVDGVFGDRYVKAEILRLPLAEDGENVNMILSAAYFERAA